MIALALALLPQIQWGPVHTVEIPWTTPNSYSHTPENPPPFASDPVLVPLAPDGTDYIRVRFEVARYGAEITCTNLSPIGAVSYELSGLYSYHLAHAPGLFSGSAANCGFPTWMIGGGDPMAARIGDVVAGGMSYFVTAQYDTTRVDDLVWIDDGGPTWPINDLLLNMTPNWLVPSRRDHSKHAIYLTSEGDTYLRWLVHDVDGSFMSDAEVDAMFSHMPWSYSLVPRVSLRVTVQYGSL